MERAVQIFAAVNFLVIGISHIFQPRAWVEFFFLLRDKGRAGAFLNGFLSLGMGSLIVAFHNVWSGPATVLTVLGWCWVLKALLAFAKPEIGMKGIARVSMERSWEFVVAGVLLVALGLFLVWLIVRG
jgi:CDP-diglyceride synthetase